MEHFHPPVVALADQGEIGNAQAKTRLAAVHRDGLDELYQE
ncbi:MAG: hypothetical protein QGF09_03130 [Rhodospirillales bacterium]|nr:hypothetical protein [Rhodospirillales bacterium]